jgi:thiol-disulfide isomerase/thioredoxin
MAFNGYLDPRSAGLTKAGFEELEIYCNWLSDNQINDTEENFIHFAVHRAELDGPRHLFNVWEEITKRDDVPMDSRLQIMRFFMNPTNDSFRRADVSGWFDFIPLAHETGKKTVYTPYSKPEFKKVAFTDEKFIPSGAVSLKYAPIADVIPVGPSAVHGEDGFSYGVGYSVEDIIDHSKYSMVVCYFWAEWCIPCESISPLFYKLVKQLEKDSDLRSTFFEFNADDKSAREYIEHFQIEFIPTVMLLNGGKVLEIFKLDGDSQLLEFLSRHRIISRM